ncbi:MAG: hypothetical protein JO057_32055, partial [Chloroflexi bacterium]|nr:hypothetical protein [Chloroflexota bacterium]
GLAVFGVACLAGVAAVLVGRVLESTERARNHRADPPARGDIPAERHHHISGVSAR